MAHKTSFILSLIFVIQLLLMMGDLASLQVMQSQMQAFATTLGLRISREGGIQPSLILWVEAHHYELSCLASCQPQFGDTLSYALSQEFDPLIISNETMTITIVRHTIIGFYY